jgi:hypothetical protein
VYLAVQLIKAAGATRPTPPNPKRYLLSEGSQRWLAATAVKLAYWHNEAIGDSLGDCTSADFIKSTDFVDVAMFKYTHPHPCAQLSKFGATRRLGWLIFLIIDRFICYQTEKRHKKINPSSLPYSFTTSAKFTFP